MNQRKSLNKIRERRALRNRAGIFGTAKRPRLAVSRSNKYIYVQLIDDEKSHTLTHASSREVKNVSGKKLKSDVARAVGELLAAKAEKLGVKSAIFDRRRYKYHGRVKALAEGARKSGLKI